MIFPPFLSQVSCKNGRGERRIPWGSFILRLVGLTHPGGKCRNETAPWDILRKEGKCSRRMPICYGSKERAPVEVQRPQGRWSILAVLHQVVVRVFFCMFVCPPWECCCHILSVRGMLTAVLSWPSLSLLSQNWRQHKQKLPHGAGLWPLIAQSVKHVCCYFYACLRLLHVARGMEPKKGNCLFPESH